MNLRPYGGFVLCRREAAEKTTASGRIIIPDTAQKKLCRGVVLQVGRGRVEEDGVFREPEAKVGETVVWDRMGSHDVPDHPELVLVAGNFILGEVVT